MGAYGSCDTFNGLKLVWRVLGHGCPCGGIVEDKESSLTLGTSEESVPLFSYPHLTNVGFL